GAGAGVPGAGEAGVGAPGNAPAAGPTDRIAGPALDLALVFTQRRHRSRTAVTVSGPTAEAWMAVAQAFAGPGTLTNPGR
ncbi:MAG: hypothetical protein ACRDYY_08525, partial [Acidimicrobiales bacterium]